MSHPASPSPTCPRCGSPVHPSIAEGQCTSCLGTMLFAADDPDAGNAATADRLQAAGRRIGNYELLERIARGGMGVVYRARQRHLHREVALKVLLDSEFAAPEERDRFRAEASAAAALTHPHIVAIHEIGEDAGHLYFSMDYVRGQDLAALTRDGPLPVRQATTLAIKIAEATQHAHERGILHRDLKPSNVLVDGAGEPRITDFGLAKRVPAVVPPDAPHRRSPESSPSDDLTLTGQILGTPGYMSPEQAGAQRDLGPASDVYSLGALLYHLLTSRAPFAAETPVATLRLVEDQDPVPPRLLNRSVPADLETICLKCLAKEPARRYPTALALAADLRRFKAGEPILARPVSPVLRALRWARRRPRVATLAAVALLLLAALIGVTAYAQLRLNEEARRLRAKDYVTDMQSASRALRDGNPGQAIDLLDRWDPASLSSRQPAGSQASRADLPDLRDFEWWLHRSQCRSDEVLTFGRHAARVTQVAYSPDGTRIASAAVDGEVRLWNASSRTLIRSTRHSKRVMGLAFSPDGTLLASGGDDRTVRLWDPGTLAPLGAPLEHNAAIVALRFSSDSRRLAVVARQERVLWDVATRAPLQRTDFPRSVWFYGVVSPDLTQIVLPLPGGTGVSVRSWDSVQEEASLPGLCLAAAFSRDGRWIALGSIGGEVSVWDARSFALRFKVQGHVGGIRSLEWSLDDTRLISGGRDARLRLWDAASGQSLGSLRGHHHFVACLALAPDGRHLVSGSMDQTVRLWDLQQPARDPERPLEITLPNLIRPSAHRWTIPDFQGSDVAWIDPATLERKTVPMPPREPGSVGMTRTFENGFLEYGPDRQLRYFRLDGTPIGDTHTTPEPIVSLAGTSSDGTRLVWMTSPDSLTHLRVLEVGWSEAKNPFPGPPTTWLTPAFSRDDRLMASINIEGELGVWDWVRREQRHRLPIVRGIPTGIRFFPDPNRIVVATADGLVREWDLNRREASDFESVGESIWNLDVSPNGRRVVGAGDAGNVYLWDVASRQVVARLRASGNSIVDSVGFSASGQELFAQEGMKVLIWRAGR